MYLGMDLGSRSVKLACLENEKIDGSSFRHQDISFFCYDTIDFYRRFTGIIDGRVNLDLEALGLAAPVAFFACGYGRQAAVSAASGVRLLGGRHFTALAM